LCPADDKHTAASFHLCRQALTVRSILHVRPVFPTGAIFIWPLFALPVAHVHNLPACSNVAWKQMISHSVQAPSLAPVVDDDKAAERARIDKLVKDILEAHWARKDIEIEHHNRRIKRHRPK
jgi:hypothetical protein